MTDKTTISKKVKKEYYCSCGHVFLHSGCACKAKCPECGAQGSAVTKSKKGVIMY